jgi:murein DD-endopeptidase MepM/ murein hydrolase activator NlpD
LKKVVVVVFVVLLAAIIAGAVILRPRFESEPPQISVSTTAEVVGAAPFDIVVSDAGTGLRALTATVTQGGSSQTLASEQLGKPEAEKKITVALAKVPGLKEGPVTLKVTARDASYWRWGAGNETAFEKNFTVDITPPTIELVADDRYVNFGGTGALVYKVSADAVKSGVKIGERFFPGFPNVVKGRPDHYFALFSHAYDVPADARPSIVATDKAGNTRELRIAYELKNVKYKKSTIALSENFLQNKVAPLVTDVATKQATPKEIFVAVNKKLRKENDDKIAEITSKATPAILWKGAFGQLSNSKVEANFADQRTYTYNGEAIDTAYHLGYDLSVTKNYPIEAANSGKVVFVGPLGIYGNTVIIDHGLGLFTLYGHLNSFDVKEGDSIEKRQPIGKTGETGLAAGDHLHYGVYLDGVAILPVEWWDPKWITDNVEPKLAGQSGQETAEAQQQAKGPAKASKAAAKPAKKRAR